MSENNLSPFVYTDHPDCNIEVELNGRILFLPKDEDGTTPPFQEMGMPARAFWEGVSQLIHQMNKQIEYLQKRIVLASGANFTLEQELESLRRKIVFVNGNKKAAFFAGLQVGKMQK